MPGTTSSLVVSAMGNHFELWPCFIMLAALVGFVADRAGICTVKAVEEMLTTRRAYLLASFAKTVLWVIGITTVLVWWLDAATPGRLSIAIVFPGLFGGFLFGIGAVMNGGCAISTLTRLGSGNLGMVVTLAGFVAGVVLYELNGTWDAWAAYHPAAPWLELKTASARMLGLLLSLWMLWEIIRLWRTTPKTRWQARLLARHYRLSTAAAIMGVSNGILYALLGTWAYSHTLRLSAVQLAGPVPLDRKFVSMALLWWLFLALIVGVLVSAFLNRRFVLAWRPRIGWFAYFSGGGLMGLGAALVPGGNDVLLLNAIPGFSPHAQPAYLAMLVGVSTALIVLKYCGGEWHVVDCRNDLCR